MTKPQLEYLGLVSTERQNMAKLGEENRSNLAKETEMHRSNIANEALKGRELDELGRHNLVTEGQGATTIGETIRSNKAREKETSKHNRAMEKQQRYATNVSAKSSKYQSDSSAAASRYSANKSAEASKYSADSSRRANKYATDAKTDIAYYDRLNAYAMNKEKLQNEKDLANLKRDTDIFLNELNRRMEGAKLKQKEKESLREYSYQLRKFMSDANFKKWELSLKTFNSIMDLVPTSLITKILK